MKNRLIRNISFVLVLALLLSCTFAYFTDNAIFSANGTAGTVAVSLDSDINLLNPDGKDIINPGDMRDSGFTVTNMGNKSIDVRTTIALTVQSETHPDLVFTGDDTTQSEYDLYDRNDVEFIEGEGWKPKAGAQPLEVKAIDQDVITYVIPGYSLNGNSDEYDEVETVPNVDEFAHTHDYVFIMKGGAGNDWQKSVVSIDVLVEAKQHENTSAGWETVAQERIETGSINKDAVKGESVITQNGNVNRVFNVVAKDEQGTDLNATATEITGEAADDLLDSLEKQGLAIKEDVDLLIDIESDDFDGLADTTIDVSSIAKDGDTVVVVHYDEETKEWEHITTDTVTDGVVNGDFSSYSPVAIIVISKSHNMLVDGPTFYGLIPDDVTDILFTNIAVPANVETIDVSYVGNDTVVAWFDDATMYVTTRDGGTMYANPNCLLMFGKSDATPTNPELQSITFDNFDTTKVTNMSHMFYRASLPSIDLSCFDTSKVTDMQYMFHDCSELITLDLSSFNTSKVTNMESMFYSCNKLESITFGPEFTTANVKNMELMFAYDYALKELDLSGFDTSKVTNMNQMFYQCTDLTTVYVSDSWTVENVTEADVVVEYCNNLVGQSGAVVIPRANGGDYTQLNYQTGVLTHISNKPAA